MKSQPTATKIQELTTHPTIFIFNYSTNFDDTEEFSRKYFIILGLSHARKLLPDEKPGDDKKYASCYFCYVCPDECKTTTAFPPPPPSPPSPKHHMSTILILMLCVLAACFMFLSYLTITRYRNCRRRNSQQIENDVEEDFIDESQGPTVDHHIWYIRTVGLQQSVIDSISTFKYNPAEGLIEGTDCSVCLNEFHEDETLRLLPKCSHAFHLHCIDTWLRSHKNCPVCRAPIISNTGSASVESFRNNLGPNEETQRRNEVEQPVAELDQAGEMRVEDETNGSVLTDEENAVEILHSTKLRVLSDINARCLVFNEELQVMRRSFSMDFSAQDHVNSITNNWSSGVDTGLVEKKDYGKGRIRNSVVKVSSSDRQFPRFPNSAKRSFSFSGQRHLSSHNGSMQPISKESLKTGALQPSSFTSL